MAELITKRYKYETYYTFLSIRSKIWMVQTFMLLLIIILGNPTSLLDKFRGKAVDNAYPNGMKLSSQEQKDRIALFDRMSFWAFMTGLYHYEYCLVIFVALVFEKQCLNWLTNRNGCTTFNLQKFIELDIRRDSLRYNWLNPKYCKYSIDNYEKHYFNNDFERVKE